MFGGVQFVDSLSGHGLADGFIHAQGGKSARLGFKIVHRFGDQAAVLAERRRRDTERIGRENRLRARLLG